MELLKSFKQYGFFEYGYQFSSLEINGKPAPYPVLNEKAVRAQAGVMAFLAAFAILNSQFAHFYIPIKIVSSAFFIDFFIKVLIGIKFSLFYQLGSFLSKNKEPEYVGAVQKRFAWSIGLILASIMMYLQFIIQIQGGITTLICLMCLLVMSLEFSFGYCVGCKIYYGLIAIGVVKSPEIAPACPGGVCPINSPNNKITPETIREKIRQSTIANTGKIGKIEYLSGLNSGKIRKMKGSIASISDIYKENIAIISRENSQYFIAYYKGSDSPLVNNNDIGFHQRFPLENNSHITIGGDEMLFFIV